MNEEGLQIIVSGVISELVGYEIVMIESSNLPHTERLVRVKELLDDMENAVIGAIVQLSQPEGQSIFDPLMQEEKHVDRTVKCPF